FSPNSAYDTNLNTLVLLSTLSQNMDSYGFYNTSIGQNPDKVSVIAQCRGDVESQTCRNCITNATLKILEVCPYKKSGFGYYDGCTLRYSNESIIGTVSNNPLVFIYNTANVSSPDEFMQEDLRTLLVSLQSKRKFARNSTHGPDFQTIHALVQCTADLSAEECFNCLRTGYESLPTCPCYGKLYATVLMPSCNFIFQVNPFSN
ncbi:cysteine-rich receptor-like protein kinase 26, partial [Nicotiana attenuata]